MWEGGWQTGKGGQPMVACSAQRSRMSQSCTLLLGMPGSPYQLTLKDREAYTPQRTLTPEAVHAICATHRVCLQPVFRDFHAMLVTPCSHFTLMADL